MNLLFGTFILVLPNPLSQSNGARGQEVKRCTCQESTRAAYGFLMRLEVYKTNRNTPKVTKIFHEQLRPSINPFSDKFLLLSRACNVRGVN